MNKKIVFKKGLKSVVNKKTTTLQDVMVAIEKWKETHKDSENILDEESCRLRHLLYDFVTDDKIEAVAKEYEPLYIEAVKQYMVKNKYSTVQDLEFVFANTDFSKEFFPEFANFVLHFILNKKSINLYPKIVFVENGKKFSDVTRGDLEKDVVDYLDKTKTDAFYDPNTNILYFKEDKIRNFDGFMKMLSHEISHVIDFIDPIKGAISDKKIQEYAEILRTFDDKEYKYNLGEKTAIKIGETIGKGFTDKLIQYVTPNKYFAVNKENIR